MANAVGWRVAARAGGRGFAGAAGGFPGRGTGGAGSCFSAGGSREHRARERGEHVGRAGAAIFAHRPANTPAKMVLVDVISDDFGAPFLAEVFRRLQKWCDRLRPHHGFGALADEEIAKAYNGVATRILMEQMAQGRADHNAQSCQKYPKQMLARGDLAAAAAGIVAIGGVKIGADLLAESCAAADRRLLDFRASDDADPMKMAVMLGIVAGFPENGPLGG